MTYLFDVDGTLTDPRKKMNPIFKRFFLEFIKTHKVCLVSGSDYKKLEEQLGSDIVDNIACVFSSSGNETYEQGRLKQQKTLPLTDVNDIIDVLVKKINTTAYPYNLKGRHIEFRPGMINFSICGRNVTQAERIKYARWDAINQERSKLCKYMAKKFPAYSFVVGGQISIDIFKKGQDKSQVINTVMLSYEAITLFGDKTMSGGNDHTLAVELKKKKYNVIHQVNNYHDTWKMLKQLS